MSGAPLGDDALDLLASLKASGPRTTGASAEALGWSHSRTWRAEVELLERGLIVGTGCGSVGVAEEACR